MSTVMKLTAPAPDLLALITLGGAWAPLLESARSLIKCDIAVRAINPGQPDRADVEAANRSTAGLRLGLAVPPTSNGGDRSSPLRTSFSSTFIWPRISGRGSASLAESHRSDTSSNASEAAGTPDVGERQGGAGTVLAVETPDGPGGSHGLRAALRNMTDEMPVPSPNRSGAAGYGSNEKMVSDSSGGSQTTYDAAQSSAAIASPAVTAAVTTTALGAPDPVTTISPAPKISFPGANFVTNGSFATDSNLAIGNAHVVTVQNSRIQWYDRSGTLQSDQSLFSFFNNPAGTAIGASRVVYDDVNDRFVVLSDAWDGGKLWLAVSKDSDPNHGWNYGSLNTDLTINGLKCWAEFPGLATDGKAIYATARFSSIGVDGVLNTSDDIFQETRLWIVNDGLGTGGIYDGGPAQVSEFGAGVVTGGTSNSFGQPAQILSPTGSFGTFLVNTSNLGRVQIIRIDNPTTSPSFTFQGLPGTPFGSFSTEGAQPGTSAKVQIHTTGNAVWRDGSLYTVGVVGPISGPDAGIATAHWYKIDTSNLDALTLVDQGDVSGTALGAGAGVATYQPSISVNGNGDFLVTYSAGGPGLYHGAYYALHAAEDAPGTMQGPQALHVGEAPYELRNSFGIVRWGDYSGTSVDPVDGTTFWSYNQYAAQRAPNQAGNWATQIAAIPTPPPVLSPLRSAADFAGDRATDLVWRNSNSSDVILWNFGPGAGLITVQDFGIVGTDWRIQAQADFTGDLKADILWRHASSGSVYLWGSNPGGVSFTGQDLGPSSFDWSIQAAADFTGDGKADVLWRNVLTGYVYLWGSNPSANSFTGQDLGLSSSEWSIQAAADFNSDTKADILWRNANGDVYLWLSNPGPVSFTGQSLGTSTPDWSIEAAADFTGDTRADILWRNTLSGGVFLWGSNPGQVSFTGQDLGPSTADWAILSTGDFTAGGRADILWQSLGGSVYLWDSNPFTVQILDTVGTDWSVAGAADFNNDGQADILWRNFDWTVQLWNFDPGSTVSFSPQDLGVRSSDWTMAAATDFTSDRQADILWRSTSSGAVSLWASNTGSLAFTEHDLGFVGFDWAIEAAADFTGDAKADILWRNTISGQVYLWGSNSGSVSFTGQDLGPSTFDWNIEAAADFTGDAKADVLWRNTTNGEVYLWGSTPGLVSFSGQSLGSSALDWSIAAAADFNGDAQADILWRGAGGNIGLWNSNPGSTAFTFQDLGTVGADWRIQAAADFTGDSRADILWRNDTGALSLWNSDAGPVAFAGREIGTAGTEWHL